MNIRDVILRNRQKEAKKADIKPRYRSVICASDGSRTNGSVWADENNKVVWHQLFGSGGVGRAKCETLVPDLGLGVIVTPTDDRLGWEVVEDDPFLRQTATDNRNYQTIQPSDLQPGGRLMLWVDSRVLMPLAIYDTSGTLQVNVISGYYIYNDTRTFFAGQVGYDLTSSVPGGGLTRYVGLYLDSANTLQRIDGATIAIGSTPSEPSWPDGAFRLGVVQLDNGQTSIDFADDIFDRRIAWSDVDSFDNWPFDNIKTVSPTNASADDSTIGDAITNADAGDVVLLDPDTTYSGQVTVNKSITLDGVDPDRTILTHSGDNADTLIVSASDVTLENLTVESTGSGASPSAVFATTQTGLRFRNCIIQKATGTPTTGIALELDASTATIEAGCQLIATAGTTRWALLVEGGCTVVIEAGVVLNGTTADIVIDNVNDVVDLRGCKLLGGGISNSGGGTLKGWYIDADGLVVHVNPRFPAYPQAYAILDKTEPDSIINGVPVIWQRGTSFTSVANDTYTADRFVYTKIGAMVHDITQDTGVPTVAQAGVLIPYSIKLDVTTVDASIAAGDFCLLMHHIEGYNWLQLAQREFTIGFWVRDTKTGIHCISFRNSGSDRSYVAEFTINAADTWEYKTVTVSASPSAGTWDYTNGAGIQIAWALAVGSTYHTTAGAWQTGQFLGTSNQVNAVDNVANNFHLTGITVTPGPYAKPVVIPDFGLEKIRAERYYQKSFAYATAPAQNVGVNTGEFVYIAHAAGAATQRSYFIPYPTVTRTTAPILTFYNPAAANGNIRDETAAADGGAPTAFRSDRGFRITATGNAATAGGNLLGVHWTADDEL